MIKIYAWLQLQTCETTCPHKKKVKECGCYLAPFELYYETKVVTGYPSCTSVEGMTWWRHQMESFSALLAICAGNSPVPGEFPTQRPVTRSFDVFFDLHPNKRLNKHWWGWWFETPSCPLWRHYSDISWWFCDLETLSPLAALCEGKPRVTGVFHSQRVSDAVFWCFLWSDLWQAVEQRVHVALGQLMVWFPQSTRHYLNQCGPSYVSRHVITNDAK